MQTLQLHIDRTGLTPGDRDRYRIYGNVDQAGRATAAARLLAGPLPLWPAGSDRNVFVLVTKTAPLYFGWYEFAVRTEDALGNLTAEAERTWRAFVNSGPEAVSETVHAGSVDGRAVFAFVPPAQMRL